jgi:hypothetical protein
MPDLLFRKSLPGGFIPTSVATGDFNGDGKMDFVVANGGDNNLWLYFGKGDGTFNPPIILPITMGQSPVWVATADLRGIGKTDLIVVEADSNSVGVFLGSEHGAAFDECGQSGWLRNCGEPAVRGCLPRLRVSPGHQL